MHNQGEDFEKSIVNWTADEKIMLDNLLKESLLDDCRISIPVDFADGVTELIEKRKSVREALLKQLMLAMGYLTILGFAFAILFYLQTDDANTILNFALRFKYPILFGIICLISIQIADVFLLSRTKDQLEN